MTNDTTYREKGRAAFLAAIMVLSMVAVPAVFMGSAAADHEPDAESVDVSDLDGGAGSNFWQGQEVTITGLGDSSNVQFSQPDGDGFFTRTANADGNVTIDTTEWSTGDWEVESDNDANGTFAINVQSFLEFSFGDDSTTGTSTLSVNSERNEYNFTVSSEGLSSDELATVFNESGVDSVTTATHDGDDVVVLSVEDASRDFDADFSSVDTGNYTIEGEVVDTGATESTSITVNDPADETADFVNGPFSEEEGDVAELELDVSGTNAAYVNVTLEDYDYTATIDLTNVGDDTVTIDANTFLMGQNETPGTFEAENADASFVEMGEYADLDGNHFNEQFTFRLRSYTQDPRSGANAADVTRLRLNDRSTGNVTTWVAPTGTDTDVDDVGTLTEDATESDSIAYGDVVIAQVDASGIYGYLGDNASSFNDAGQNLSFALESETSTPFGSDVSSVPINGDNTSLVTDAANDTFYVAFNTEDISEIEADSEWEAVFEIGTENPYMPSDAEDPETASGAFDVNERNLEFTGEFDENDRLQVDATSESEIGAETNVAPGTSGNYFVETQDDAASDEFTVGEDGVITATFDFSGAENGEILPSIEFEEDGGESISTEGVFGEGREASFVATGDAPDQVDVDGDATLDATVENQGGSSGEASISVTVDGEEVAAENVELGSGESWEDSFEIPTGEEGEIEWEIDAGTSSDSGTVQVGESGDDTGGDDMDGDDAAGDDTGGDGDGDGDGQPGFGVFVALFALIGAALLALRRQN